MDKKIVIGFTCGAWDIFHYGHTNFLKKCREHCDYLIVGIVTDYWLMVQKGHNRPMDSLQLRLTNLRDSGLTDKIVICDTLDMSQYIQMVDVWIKGADQKSMRPLEYANIIYIERTPKISTTQIIEETERRTYGGTNWWQKEENNGNT